MHRRPPRTPSQKPAASTSWEDVSDWYSAHVSKRSTLQSDIVYPGALRLLAPKDGGTYLDVACGEGVFLRQIQHKAHCKLIGLDAAPSLIQRARKSIPTAELFVANASDFTKNVHPKSCDGASCLLAIQNIENSAGVFQSAARALKPGAPFVIVMNHPCFRIPRQSSWEFDEKKKWMYRRVDRYLSPLDIPIQAHPGAARDTTTTSFHRPLSTYITELAAAGFTIDALEEWTSNRESKPGGRSRAENASRSEFPLFLTIRARAAL